MTVSTLTPARNLQAGMVGFLPDAFGNLDWRTVTAVSRDSLKGTVTLKWSAGAGLEGQYRTATVDAGAEFVILPGTRREPAPVTLSNAPARVTPCYCDSAYHPQGHRA